jgi:sulfotransferase family protein
MSVATRTLAVNDVLDGGRRRHREEHVVHIGYHKTASTWLQFYVFPYLAGLCYHDPLLGRVATNLATAESGSFFGADCRLLLRQIARRSGGRLLLSHEGLSGSLWDGYGSGLRTAERLRRVLPGARILVFVRRQQDMLRSIHAQYVNEGGTRTLRDFVESQELEGCRFSLRHLEYDQLVEHYVNLFGGARIWVVPYEYLRAEPERFLAELCELLGTTLTAKVGHTWPNRSLPKPTLWLLRSWNRLFHASRFNAHPLVFPVRGSRHARRLLQGADPIIRPVLWNGTGKREARLLANLATGFADSNQRLQRFCRYSLASWGYTLPSAGYQRGSDPRCPEGQA